MRVLIDECLPRQLVAHLVGHEARTVQQVGWAGVKNGKLLAKAAGEFDAFITIDRRLPLDHRPPPSLAIVSLTAKDNRVETICGLAPAILDALTRAVPGQVVKVGV